MTNCCIFRFYHLGFVKKLSHGKIPWVLACFHCVLCPLNLSPFFNKHKACDIMPGNRMPSLVMMNNLHGTHEKEMHQQRQFNFLASSSHVFLSCEANLGSQFLSKSHGLGLIRGLIVKKKIHVFYFWVMLVLFLDYFFYFLIVLIC